MFTASGVADSLGSMSDSPCDRREFLKRLGKAGVVVAASGAVTAIAYEPKGSAIKTGHGPKTFKPSWIQAEPPLLVVASGAPSKAVAAGLEALGGMKAFVSKGARVVIKPNMGWDRTPELAANTNPEVVAAIVRLCREAGAGRVVVTDNPCHEARLVFDHSGIAKAAADAGAEVLLPDDSSYVDMDLGGQALKVFPVLKAVAEADVLINVPIAKHHAMSILTASLKNLYGVLGKGRNRLHQDMDLGIAELGKAFRPPLNIVDATRAMVRNGPTGGQPSDVESPGRVVFSRDPVAADTWVCRYIHRKPDEVAYLAKAAAMGVGNHRIESLQVTEVAG